MAILSVRSGTRNCNLVRKKSVNDIEKKEMLNDLKPSDIPNYIKNHRIDFLDFGCSTGRSLRWAQRTLGGVEGLGIDNSPQKVQRTVTGGFQAVNLDVSEIPDRKMVRFVVLSHFLEHVSDLALVRQFVIKACRVSTEFVLITQPYFDADGYLLQCGLKTYWSDWHGHPNLMSSMSLYQILRDAQAAGHCAKFSICARDPILTSSDSRIHPLSSPKDQHHYRWFRDPPKPRQIKFETPVFAELVAFITMHGIDHDLPFKNVPVDVVLHRSP